MSDFFPTLTITGAVETHFDLYTPVNEYTYKCVCMYVCTYLYTLIYLY